MQPNITPPEKTRQYGPKKEKEQITIRIDKELLDAFHAQNGLTKLPVRITDLIEEGLVLALRKRNENFAPLTNQVRFMVANTTLEEQAHIRQFLTFLVLPKMEKLTPTEALMHKCILNFLDLFVQDPEVVSYATEVFYKWRA